jgi:adenine deaminase
MTSSSKLTRALVDTAMGRVPADMVILNGQWVCVQSGEILPGTDIAIKDGHVAYVGESARHTIGKKTKVIEAKGHVTSCPVCSTVTCTSNRAWSR